MPLCTRARAAGSCAARSRPGPPAMRKTPPTTPTMPSAPSAEMRSPSSVMATSDDSSGPVPRPEQHHQHRGEEGKARIAPGLLGGDVPERMDQPGQDDQGEGVEGHGLKSAKGATMAPSRPANGVYARPMMEAVAMSSSSSANDTLPDTA